MPTTQGIAHPYRCDEHYREECGLSQLDMEKKVFIDRCHELEQVKHETTRRKKSKAVHEQNRKPTERAVQARNPDVRELLDPFNRKM